MRIDSVEIEEYRRLKNCRAKFISTDKNFLVESLYGNLGITLIAGPNGSGKTSLLSFIAQVFHNLQRFPERIPGQFRINYTNHDGSKCSLYRNNKGQHIFLSVDGVFDLPVQNLPSGIYQNEGQDFVCYESIMKYLPPAIIVSAFSLHGEYPSVRPKNFKGDRRLAVYDTANLYGNNHFGFPSFSRAICTLMNAVKRKTAGIKALETLLGAKFTGEVLVHERGFYDGLEQDWIMYSKSVEELEHADVIYVNDIRLKNRAGTELRLSNMSSGQKMLFVRLLTVLGKISDGALILLEEPEIHLDPAWSRQLVSLLLLFFREYHAHMVIATHSFSLLNAVPTECILLAKDGAFIKPPAPTLLANESALSNMLYDADMHEVEKRIVEFCSRATFEELRSLFSLLGESSVRFDVFSQIREFQGKHDA